MADDSQNISGAYPKNNLLINQNCAGSSNMFDMNKILSAITTYKSINYAINQMIGADTKWFRAVPSQRSKDVIFQEYTLSDVEECPHDVKVVFPKDSKFPDKYNYDLMGLQYEIPLEVEIDKLYWEDKVGAGTAPQKDDIVYLVIPNLLYDIESSFLHRGFMEQITTWKVRLKKHVPKAERREGAALKDTIDQYTVSEAEIFGDAIQKNVNKLTDKQQFSQFNSTSRDLYKSLDPSINAIRNDINVYGTVVAESYYDMYFTKDSSHVIQYNIDDIFTTDTDKSLTAWFSLKTFDTDIYDVNYIIEDTTYDPSANYKIAFKTSKIFNVGDTFIISKPGAMNFYATVIVVSEKIYYCKIDEKIITYLSDIKSDWTTLLNYKMQVKAPLCLIDSSNENFKIELYANQYIKMKFNQQIYISILSEKLEDNIWYGFTANIGSTWKQFNTNIWKINDTQDYSNKLVSIHNETQSLVPENFNIGLYHLNKSQAYFTHLRIFNVTIEDEKQVNNLLMYFTSDADYAILMDNADPKFLAPYISKHK
jgi:hypothetical protein